jgi:hypothetical protein
MQSTAREKLSSSCWRTAFSAAISISKTSLARREMRITQFQRATLKQIRCDFGQLGAFALLEFHMSGDGLLPELADDVVEAVR